jgi:regulator of sigma E protease
LRVRESEGRSLKLGVDRAGQDVEVDVTPKPRDERDALGEVIGQAYMIGIERALEPHAVGFFDAVKLGARYTWGFTRLIFETLARLFQGRVSANDLGGPIMIAQEAGRRAASGLEPLLRFMALISINLGVINVLPVPVLDGGHLAFFLFEAVRGRPLSVRYREIAQQVGVFLLLALMVFVVFNDISRIVSG